MIKSIRLLSLFLLLTQRLVVGATEAESTLQPKALQVFILAGQSNMEGPAVVDLTGKDYNEGKGTLAKLMEAPAQAPLLAHLQTADGKWTVRDDVWVRYKREHGPLLAGPHSIGFSVHGAHHFGPELQFGHVVGDAIANQVLLIKTAWGGKSLFEDFRPPSSGGTAGVYYTKMIAEVREALANLKTDFPNYQDTGYEMAGFVWYQGWNDGCMPQTTAVADYEQNLVNLIHDVRAEFKTPKLPVVIGELTGPWVQADGDWNKLRQAQAAAARREEFKGSVVFVPTHDFVRAPQDSPNPGHGHHEFGNAETYFLVGDALGKGMTALLSGTPLASPPVVQAGEMAGYLLVPHEKVPESFNAGFSVYAAAWPLLDKYPGHQFQTGLFGTWMFAQNDPKPPGKMYSDVEGGLGWWRDTHFPTETPKFIMGGVAPNFSEIANGPGYGAGDWKQPRGLYGVAQLSPWIVFPLDGMNVKQGTCGQLFGYGYLPLPLATAKTTTAGENLPTGAQCWTLFFNTGNFKGPVAFFLPYFWSHSTLKHPEWAGLLLDSRPSEPNKAIQMETQYVPSVQSVDGQGQTYARIAPTAFPAQADGTSLLVHRVTAYNQDALWNDVQRWFEGGPAATGAVHAEGSATHTFKGDGGATWKIYTPTTPKEQQAPLAWKSFATPFAPDPLSYGYRWNADLVQRTETAHGSLVTLPEYFHLNTNGKKPEWQVVPSTAVPNDSGLTQYRFTKPHEAPQEPRVTPDAPTSCWKSPGPVAGPCKVKLGDGSTLTYAWYRFADQPALLNADLSKAEREQMQTRVEKLHRAWTKDRDYLAPPTVGTLADLDPAQLVTPPAGLEIGYVPIALRQELESAPAP